MISHKNIVSLIPSVKEFAGLDSQDSYLSYLPMAHIMEKATFNMALYFSVKIGVFSRNTRKLTEDL